MEIGSFIELQLKKGMEFYDEKVNIARLNTGRAAIYHALRVTGCDSIWLPYYQCDTVRDFLLRKGCSAKFYHIDENFDPIDLTPSDNEAVLLVNYYGIMSNRRMSSLASKYSHPIIDNCQAFFAYSIENALNVYSARKFVGVPDGAYVIGENADKLLDYSQGYSSDTSLFLLQRIEYGCEGKAYESRMINEHRIDSEDVMLMSKLTHAILDGTDYDFIIRKRKQNFKYAEKLFSEINLIDATAYYDSGCVPMVYPLVFDDDTLLESLQNHKHFQGHWWSYILNEGIGNEFENMLSRYIIPITIDQRYGEEELNFIRSII